MRIAIFLEGTLLIHPTWVDLSREQRVEASRRGGVDSSQEDVPVGLAARRLHDWTAQAAEIQYLTARRSGDPETRLAGVLARIGFPRGTVHARKGNQSYGDVTARVHPDLLIEDDCESIGLAEMTYPQIPSDARAAIGWIVIPEFGGIDHLPAELARLRDVANWGADVPVDEVTLPSLTCSL